MSGRIKNAVWSALALLSGALLYVLLRPDSYIGKLFSEINNFQRLQEKVLILQVDFLRYHLSDLLWSFALGCSLQAVMNPKGKGIVACGTVALLCGFLWELMQWSGAIEGTGDWLDVLMYLLGSFLSGIINLKGKRK